jgi:spectinomycin phosphotransferase
MYEKLNIPDDALRAVLRDQYGVEAAALTFLPLGLDSMAGVYRVVSEQGTAYLLKAKAGPFYEAGYLVARYLRDQGITEIVAPLRAKLHALWTKLGEWTITLYPFIDGEHGWTPGMTDAQWQAVGTVIRQMHQVRLPQEGFAGLRRETFDPTGYRRSVAALEAEHIVAAGGSQAEQALRAVWLEHRALIHQVLASLETLAALLRRQAGPFVVCHADLHPSNIMRAQNDQVFVIDWDDVLLAPKERDFIFVGEAPAHGSVRAGRAAFFAGYGDRTIDWVALTYYLWERVMQDVISFAEEVVGRDDLEEASKAESVAWFRVNLTKAGGSVDRAWAAAGHLPAELGLASKGTPYEY